MKRLKRIGVLFLAKLQAMIMAVVGLLAGIIYSVGGFIYELSSSSLNWGTALAFGALIGMPLLFALFGFVAGATGAVIYNLIAKLINGIEVDLDAQ